MERLVLDLILLLAFLGVSALLAGAEAAYFSLSRLGSAHLEPKESPGTPCSPGCCATPATS